MPLKRSHFRRALAALGALGALLAPSATMAQAPAPPGAPAPSLGPAIYLDPSRPVEARVSDLLARMTLAEKISLIHADGKFTTPAIPHLGIPRRTMSDGPHGVREEIGPDTWDPSGRTDDFASWMPVGISLAATWNTDLAHAYGQVIGQEALKRGKDIMLGPGVNIMRTPLNGRNYEYFGEDPWLSGRMAVGYIQGAQSQGIASCVKHFAANNQERQRGTIDVEMDDRTLHEIYLPAFKAAVQEGGVWAVMGAYNQFRGQHCCENDLLLNRILKGSWGFQGLVMSDWSGVHDTAEAAFNGMDLEMGTNKPYDQYYLAGPFQQGLQNGTYPMALLDDKVRRNLRVMFATHAFDGRPLGSLNTPEHQATARRIADEALVLLKNQGAALPLDAAKLQSIAVIGEDATQHFAYGGQSAGIKAFYEVTPLDGILRRVGPQVTVSFSEGYRQPARRFGRRPGQGFGQGPRPGGASGQAQGTQGAPAQGGGQPPTATPGQPDAAGVRRPDVPFAPTGPDPVLIARAVAAARQADVAIIVAGLNHTYDSEGSDRPDMALPYGQDELIRQVVAANPRTIVVLMDGGPVEMDGWLPQVPAVLQAWYPGMEGGNAVAGVLFGDVNPSGKLPCTFPHRLADSPAHALNAYPGENGVEHYTEGLLVGYRWFDARNIAPLFPFGHGLSYTSFRYGNLKIVRNPKPTGPVATVTFDVTNTGARAGAEVAQVYIHPLRSGLPRPPQELKGFRKVLLAPGQTQTVSVPLTRDAFAYWDPAKNGWLSEAGTYDIRVGASSRDIRLQNAFKLAKTALVKD